jgi:hypothetical protein
MAVIPVAMLGLDRSDKKGFARLSGACQQDNLPVELFP